MLQDNTLYQRLSRAEEGGVGASSSAARSPSPPPRVPTPSRPAPAADSGEPRFIRFRAQGSPAESEVARVRRVADALLVSHVPSRHYANFQKATMVLLCLLALVFTVFVKFPMSREGDLNSDYKPL